MHIPDPLRILSVPTDHPYVRHLTPTSGRSAVLRLPDPPVPGAPAGQWWPSPVLDPAWLRARAGDVDAVHLHFGFEHRTAAQLAAWVAVLRELGLPLVLTVHDLDNPHLVDQAPHRAALDVLVPAAGAVLTLTPGAAREIARRWGRQAVVVPHPHVVDLERMRRPRPARAGFVVGLHAKRRGGSDPGAVLPELRRAVRSLPGGRLHEGLTTRVPDDALWDHLAGLDLLVLPYRAATHSGFVEACHDLGTAVAAPRLGHLAEQHPVHGYDLGVPGSLTQALLRAYAARPPRPADPAVRARQRDELDAAHTAVYRAVLAGPGRAAA